MNWSNSLIQEKARHLPSKCVFFSIHPLVDFSLTLTLLQPVKGKIHVLMMVGMQGAGKTTTCTKVRPAHFSNIDNGKLTSSFCTVSWPYIIRNEVSRSLSSVPILSEQEHSISSSRMPSKREFPSSDRQLYLPFSRIRSLMIIRR